MQLIDVDKKIHECCLCGNMVEKFPNTSTVSLGNKKIVIIGEAPVNNGWRKSGIAWHDLNNKLLPSAIVLQKLLSIINLKIEDTYFMEAIKCFPKERKNLIKCSDNCKNFLFEQLEIIKPKIILALGDAATKTILNIKYKNFLDIIGKEFEVNGVKIIPIYHPSPISPKGYNGNIEIFKKIQKLINNY